MPINNNNRVELLKEFAVIDLGSHSFHMIIARKYNGLMRIIDRLKQHVHLAAGLDQNNMLSEEAIERGLACLSLFAERLYGLALSNVCIVGTHTLRCALNASDFLNRAKKIIPYPIKIISDKEEIRLTFIGVENTQLDKGRKLVIDIGGGSTELVIGENFQPILSNSYQIGCIRFAHIYFPGGVISREHLQCARIATIKKIKSIAWQYRIKGWDIALGASGSIKAIYEVLLAMGEKDGLITSKRLTMLSEEVLKYKNFNSLTLPGLTEERKTVFIPGLAILHGVFDTLSIQELYPSHGTLREGILYEMESRVSYQNILNCTARNLIEQYNIDQKQAQRVLETTMYIYMQWAGQNSKLVHPQLILLLKWAAFLHEIGLNINYKGMHHHSAYILQHSDLPGYNQEQQTMIATLVRYHRKSIKLDDLPHFTLFKKKQFLPLIQLLRLGVLLNNRRHNTVLPSFLTLKTHHNRWTLIFPHNWFNHNALLLFNLKKEQQYWKEISNWVLEIAEDKLP